MASIELNARQRTPFWRSRISGQPRSLSVGSRSVLNTASVTFALLACAAAAVQVRRHVRLLWQQGVSSWSVERMSSSSSPAGVAHDVLSPLGAVAARAGPRPAAVRRGDPALKGSRRGRQAIAARQAHDRRAPERSLARAPRPEPGARAEVCARHRRSRGRARSCRGGARRGAPRRALHARARVAASPGVLTSILANLTRNALKYLGDAAGLSRRDPGARRERGCADRGGGHGARRRAGPASRWCSSLMSERKALECQGLRPGPRHRQTLDRGARRPRGAPHGRGRGPLSGSSCPRASTEAAHAPRSARAPPRDLRESCAPLCERREDALRRRRRDRARHAEVPDAPQ